MVAKRTPTLTADRARELLTYDPETGLITAKHRRGSARMDSSLGTSNGKGYLRMIIDRQRYSAHRLAWLLHYGNWPETELDHVDGDRANNRINNLRLATTTLNAKNQRKPRNNTSGQIGVCYSHQHAAWLVRISNNGHRINIGFFDGYDDAVAARKAAERQYNYHPNHGR